VGFWSKELGPALTLSTSLYSGLSRKIQLAEALGGISG
jgi:hypothetical protein